MNRLSFSMMMGLLVLGTAAVVRSVPDVLVFRTSDNRQTTASGDWAPGQYKAECSSWVTGVSESTADHTPHAVLCNLVSGMGTPGVFLGSLDFSGGDNRPSPYLSTDWDPGYSKAECGRSQNGAVVGVAQTTAGTVTKIACRAGAPAGAVNGQADCQVRMFYSRDSIGNASSNWDAGTFRGECQAPMFLRGLSRDPVSGAPHALLCCL